VESLRNDNAATVGLRLQLTECQEQVAALALRAELRAARAKASTDELVHADLQAQLSGEREQTAGLRSQLEELRQQLNALTAPSSSSSARRRGGGGAHSLDSAESDANSPVLRTRSLQRSESLGEELSEGAAAHSAPSASGPSAAEALLQAGRLNA